VRSYFCATPKACGTDKAAAVQIANHLTTDAMLRREGLIDPTVDRISAAERKTLSSWLEAFSADILARNGNAPYASQIHQRAGRIIALGSVVLNV
jgi:hypothetical protein